MTFDLKYEPSELTCEDLRFSSLNQSFERCTEDDKQILEWIRTVEFQPSEELDKQLKSMKETIDEHYMRGLIGINDLGMSNVVNRTLAYKITLIKFLVEVLRKYEQF